jgi:hypothetical protein
MATLPQIYSNISSGYSFFGVASETFRAAAGSFNGTSVFEKLLLASGLLADLPPMPLAVFARLSKASARESTASDLHLFSGDRGAAGTGQAL